jgi:putative ABC transport system ATP-binding protein
MILIEAREISKDYRSGANLQATRTLQPTSVLIEKGEFISIVGPSGSGKSTLMNILGLLDRPTAGQIFFEGKDCGRLNSDELARIRNRHIGFVFQAFHLLPRLTAINNVELPLIYAGLKSAERRNRAESALEAVGLADKTDRLPAELSGGEQQRVAIARATVAEPSLVLADEPTGALDSVSGRTVIDILRRLHRAGSTVIVVTHDHDIAQEASRKLRIKDGRLEESALSRSAQRP